VLNSSTVDVKGLQQSWLSLLEKNPTSHYSRSGGHASQGQN
jgi:hypothetical protein